MNLFCSKGGFHKYEYYIGPHPDGFEVECERCTKCGKIFDSNEVISNEFIYEERKRTEEFLNKIEKEVKEMLNDPNDCYSNTKQYQNIISFYAAKRKLKDKNE
jgi:uncharacterized protein YfcZ (UPF0381/DUF406 family)